jgi:hypothetical protein
VPTLKSQYKIDGAALLTFFTHQTAKMGQYYHAVILDADGQILAWVSSWTYFAGHKLTEHSYVGNAYTSAVEWLLSPEGDFHRGRLVWAGDYAGDEPCGMNLYELCLEATADHKLIRSTPKSFSSADYPYLVNHTQKEFVKKPDIAYIHPLCILTAEGNGRGGGDYRGRNEEMAGRWARNVISVEKEIPEGYEELKVEFDLV